MVLEAAKAGIPSTITTTPITLPIVVPTGNDTVCLAGCGMQLQESCHFSLCPRRSSPREGNKVAVIPQTAWYSLRQDRIRLGGSIVGIPGDPNPHSGG